MEEEYNNQKNATLSWKNWAFSQLNYENPDLEAQYLTQVLKQFKILKVIK
jgi:hypothetical protein